jgi:hypothetical protein
MVLQYLDKIGEITSVKVAREHIDFLAAQLEAKNTEIDALREEKNAEIDALGIEVERLKSENDRIMVENSTLKAALEEATKEGVRAARARRLVARPA